MFLTTADGYGQGMVRGGWGGDEGSATKEEASNVMTRGTHLTAAYLALFTFFSISGLIVLKLLWAIKENIRISISYRL